LDSLGISENLKAVILDRIVAGSNYPGSLPSLYFNYAYSAYAIRLQGRMIAKSRDFNSDPAGRKKRVQAAARAQVQNDLAHAQPGAVDRGSAAQAHDRFCRHGLQVFLRITE
jgi:hypothetical protein